MNKTNNYFEGWYFKHQNNDYSIAFIVAQHVNNGIKKVSLQIIDPEHSYNIDYPASTFRYTKKPFKVVIGNNIFSKKGIKLDIMEDEIKIKGNLKYSAITKIKYDIMGPFMLVPMMECYHGVISVKHLVNGSLMINQIKRDFNKTIGYIEKDQGNSFPSDYLWTQVLHKDTSIFLSIANIPMLKTHFLGTIGFVYYQGQEYRFATYLGAKVMLYNFNKALIKQGENVLSVEVICAKTLPLKAPMQGNMNRTINECLRAKIRYECWIKDKLILDFISEEASYEYSDNGNNYVSYQGNN